MARETTFGTVRSYTDLGLIQQSVVIEPAIPKTNYVNLPGMNGMKDLTEALGVGVKYEDRKITWTFALYPGADWYAKMSEVSNAINGKACHITLSDDPTWYYDGRASVTKHTSNRLLKQITVEAICRPYKLKPTETTVSRTDLTTSNKNVVLHIGMMPVIPVITINKDSFLSWNGLTYDSAPGTFAIPAWTMSGEQTIRARILSSADMPGSITVTWREGSL